MKGEQASSELEDLKTENDICMGRPNIMYSSDVQTILQLSATSNPAAFTHGLVHLTSVTHEYYVSVRFKLSQKTTLYWFVFEQITYKFYFLF